MFEQTYNRDVTNTLHVYNDIYIILTSIKINNMTLTQLNFYSDYEFVRGVCLSTDEQQYLDVIKTHITNLLPLLLHDYQRDHNQQEDLDEHHNDVDSENEKEEKEEEDQEHEDGEDEKEEGNYEQVKLLTADDIIDIYFNGQQTNISYSVNMLMLYFKSRLLAEYYKKGVFHILFEDGKMYIVYSLVSINEHGKFHVPDITVEQLDQQLLQLCHGINLDVSNGNIHTYLWT